MSDDCRHVVVITGDSDCHSGWVVLLSEVCRRNLINFITNNNNNINSDMDMNMDMNMNNDNNNNTNIKVNM